MSKYDLVAGDKSYPLDTKDESSSDALDKLAGQQAKVKGEENGDTIVVESVAAAECERRALGLGDFSSFQGGA